MQVVHADAIDVDRQPAYVAEVAATVTSGNGVRGIELGVEIAQTARTLTGSPTSFSIATTGAYGAVAWHTAFDSITDLQRGQEALMDPRIGRKLWVKCGDHVPSLLHPHGVPVVSCQDLPA